MAFGVKAQNPATDLVQLPVQQMELGQAIDIHDQYTIVGSKFGKNTNSGAMLFHNNEHIRTYKVSSVSGDGLGEPKTVAIGQHAIVLGAPKFRTNLNTPGRAVIINKTWDGTHYQDGLSQTLNSGTTENTSFGRAVAISDNWVAIGAPGRGQDGGVKMYYRNPGTGYWEDKGYLELPDFSNAPNRYWIYNNAFINDADFGSSLDIMHGNMIIGAPGIGSFYLYKLEGNNWVYSGEFQGENSSFSMGSFVAISDQHAVATGGSEVQVYKKHWDGTWIPFQKLSFNGYVNDLAVEDNRLVLGMPNDGEEGKGLVRYFQLMSHPVEGTWQWVYDFVEVGRMPVSASVNPEMTEYRLLGYAVAMHHATVVAGAPNAYYETVADGAGFKSFFYNMAPVWNNSTYRQAAVTSTIANTESGNLGMYPNPARDVLNLTSPANILSATAVNALGKKTVLQSNPQGLDVSGLSSGVYMVTVNTNMGTVTERIVIQ